MLFHMRSHSSSTAFALSVVDGRATLALGAGAVALDDPRALGTA
jgi:hypothetical protein